MNTALGHHCSNVDRCVLKRGVSCSSESLSRLPEPLPCGLPSPAALVSLGDTPILVAVAVRTQHPPALA